MMSQNIDIDPALTEHLDQLVELANEIGAEGIFLIRGAKNARLLYDYQELEAPAIPGIKNASTTLGIAFEVADAGVLAIIRFPSPDGKELGIESR